jgi:hypothetical protein
MGVRRQSVATAAHLTWVVCLALCVSGCDLLEDSNSRPWRPYAWHKKDGRQRWWFPTYETRRDCLEATRHAVATVPQSEWYSEPVGCGYIGNSYWRVRILNSLNNVNYECIAKNSDADAAKAGESYSPVLKGYPRPQGSVYCFD